MTREEALVILNKCEDELFFKDRPIDFLAFCIAKDALEYWEPVVHCKDCDRSGIDYDDNGEPMYYCTLYNPVRLVVKKDGTGYCNNGGRK